MREEEKTNYGWAQGTFSEITSDILSGNYE